MPHVHGGTACTGTGNVGLQTFSVVDRLTNDLQLLPGAPAINARGPTCSATDIDGDTRPAGAACDAGGDENS
jgi:hypothetical protein